MTISVAIIDDDAAMRAMLRRALAVDGFEVVGEAADGGIGAEMVADVAPDVILVDLSMPVRDGVTMIRDIRSAGLAVRALVLTSSIDHDAITAAITAGADGYVLKGSPAEEIREAIRNVSAGGSALTPRVARSVLDGYVQVLEDRGVRDLAVITTLAGAVEARDQGTGDHARNVTRLSGMLWRSVTGADAHEDLPYGFLLHDVGKIAIPDKVLLKPGALSTEEIAMMRTHVQIGMQLVAPLGFRQDVIDVIACHHERFDGTGYPRGLRGDAIPLAARMFSVVDAFDAMTRDRPYRRATSASQAVAELQRCAGKQFDPMCVEAFTRMLGVTAA